LLILLNYIIYEIQNIKNNSGNTLSTFDSVPTDNEMSELEIKAKILDHPLSCYVRSRDPRLF
jgi:hypothetical protein